MPHSRCWHHPSQNNTSTGIFATLPYILFVFSLKIPNCAEHVHVPRCANHDTHDHAPKQTHTHTPIPTHPYPHTLGDSVGSGIFLLSPAPTSLPIPPPIIGGKGTHSCSHLIPTVWTDIQCACNSGVPHLLLQHLLQYCNMCLYTRRNNARTATHQTTSI